VAANGAPVADRPSRRPTVHVTASRLRDQGGGRSSRGRRPTIPGTSTTTPARRGSGGGSSGSGRGGRRVGIGGPRAPRLPRRRR
jgi:hypothetical protein